MNSLTSAYKPCCCKVRLSNSLQSRNVRSRGAVRNVGIDCTVSISKDCGKSGTVSSFHAFHQAVISTASVFRSRFRYPFFSLLVFTFGAYLRS